MSNYEKVKKWRLENKDKVAAQARRYRRRHPDKIKSIKVMYLEKSKEKRLQREAEIARKKRKADPEGYRRRSLEYAKRRLAKREEIAGRKRPSSCELCGNDGVTVFDHCHVNGHFRGWICDRCNKVLGLIKDNTSLLTRMIKYLENSNGKVNYEATKQSSKLSICWSGS